MGFNFENLDQKTRELMEAEVNFDLERNNLYLGKTLSELGKNNYLDLLREAIRSGSEESLAVELNKPGYFNLTQTRIMKNGPPILAKVPVTANETLAEGELNRFYIRALCLKAIEENSLLEVYRAKQVSNPRIESEQMIGKTVDSKALLEDLRTNPGVDTALGLPQGPNSGLSVKLKAN